MLQMAQSRHKGHHRPHQDAIPLVLPPAANIVVYEKKRRRCGLFRRRRRAGSQSTMPLLEEPS